MKNKPNLPLKVFITYLMPCLFVFIFNPYSAKGQLTCEEITEIYCGGYEDIEFTTVFAENTLDIMDYTSCHSSSSPFDAKNVVFKLEKPSGRTWHISIYNQEGVDLDMFLFTECPLEGGLGFSSSLAPECIGKSVNSYGAVFSGYNFDVLSINTPGTYYIVVDGFNVNQEGSFRLNVGCDELPNICPTDPQEIFCGQTLDDNNFGGFVNGTTSMINHYNCLSVEQRGCQTAPEKVYTFIAPSTGIFTFDLYNFNNDLDFFAIDNLCNPNPPAFSFNSVYNCIGSGTNPQGIPEQISLPLFAGQKIYLVVDGALNIGDNFSLSVSCAGNICDNAIDINCGQNYVENFILQENNVTRYQCSGGFERYEDSEVIYTFTPAVSQTYTFNALGSFGTSPAIFISDCCDVGNNSEPELTCPFLDCSFSNDLGITRNSAFLTAGVTYYIFVEKASQSSSDDFVFWVNCDCNLFRPLANQTGNDIIFENNSQGTYVSHTIKFPFDENGQNYTYTDSLSQINGDGTISCHFPFPGCYEVCFYYRVNNQIRKCCFKYCPIIKKYDCVYPIIEEVNMTNNSSTIRVTCEDGGMVGKNSLMMEDICLIKVKPTNGTTISEYPCGSDINLPHGEYEICCWHFDPVCHAWDVCCKIICLPYIPPADLACGKENILVEKLSPTEYKYTWSGSQDGLEWTIMPSVNFTTNGNMMTARYPGPGVYKVCGIGLTNMGTIILRDTCCVYTCIDNELDIPCENSFRVIPLPNNKVRLVCTVGRPVLRWEVTLLEGLAITTVYYGDSPIIDLFPNSTYDIKKVFDGCCGTEESCTKRFCYTDPFDCTFIMPRYLGGPGDLSLEYGFNIPDDLVGVEWRIDELDMVIGENTRSVSYNFLTPGCYTISVLIYDPVNECYVICCKRICITYPYDCTLLKHWFRGNEGNSNVYTIELNSDCTEPMRQMSDIKWSINGIHYPEYDGLSTLNDIDLSFYGQPGTDIFICAMFYDPCLDACRWCYLKIRLEPPFNCNTFTPLYVSENNYTFTTTGNYEKTYWMIGGMEGLCFNMDQNTFDLSDPEIQNYITAQQPEYLFVYFYYRVGFCWKVCCIRVCLKGPDGCEQFGEECDYFRPIYNEDFENGPPLGYGYMEGDSININMDWWKGQGLVEGGVGKMKNDEILCLKLDDPSMDNVNVFKVAFEFEAQWAKFGINSSYGVAGDFLLCQDDTQSGGAGICYTPALFDILDNNPSLLKDCGGGGIDVYSCMHKVELLIDRSGPITMFIDGRKVNYTGFGGNNWENQGAAINKINFAGNNEDFSFVIDNICIAECMTCQPPTVDPGDFFPCDDIVLNGFGSGGNDVISGQFTYNGTPTGEGWVVKEVLGTVMTTVYEDFSGSTTLTFPGFLPGKTYIVCFKYLDENGCVQYCCYKVNIPDGCHYYTPYFAGDDDPENLTFDFVLENPNPDGLELVAWYVGDTKVADNVSTLTYRFPGQGTYYVYCVFWDPLTKCYVWCCRRICVEYPLNCDRIIIDYDGADNEYILSAEGIQQIISWNIDIPTGLPNRGYIGMENPQRFNPADFGILPGQEIVISVRYIDADGCLKICCRRICIPVTTPVEECNNIFPIYTGNELQYTFEVNPSDDFEDIVWRLHIPGTDQTIDIGSGPMSNVVDFEALTLLYPTLTLDKVCISIFYRDRVTGCYKVCCKCFCIAQNPFECTSIKYYYSGSPTNPLIYNFVLDVPGAQFISWTLDNTNTFLSDQASFEVDFGTLGVTLGSEIFVTVRYYDPVSECFRICCKRLCLTNPYLGCDKITSGLPVNNIISLSTSVNNPVWTIEGVPGIYSESQNPTINLTDPQIIPLIEGSTTINVCVVYMENGCCRVCCTPVCVLPETVDCDNFDITSVIGVNNFTFTFTDTNTGAIETKITLPNASIITLGGTVASYTNMLEGNYRICRVYVNGCNNLIECCQDFCLSFGLNCEPITFSIDPANDRIYTFTHNIIGGVSYLWDFGDGTTSTSDMTSVSHTYPSENRQYTVCLTVTDECNTFCQQCRDIAVGEINFSPVVVNPSCGNINDGSINLNISGGIPPVQILWSNAATTEVINNLGAGNYSVTVTDGSGKDTTFTFTLTAPELANLEATITQTSCGENNGEIRISVLNNVAIQSYSWSLASLASDSVVSMLAAGSYNVTVTDVNGCTSSLEGIIVNASEALALFNFGSDMTLCANEVKTLDVGVVNASNVTIEWFRNGVLLLSNTRTLEVSGAGTYVAVVSNSQNCVRRDTIIVNYFDDVIELPEDRIDIDLDEVVTLEVIGAISAEWVTTDAELSCTSCLLTTFTFLQNTTIIVTATDANGCTKTDTIELRFDTSPIDGPNFITPNGDGANDVLEFENLDRFTYRKLIIFNRWGQIVRTFEGYNNDWDGTLDGRPLPDGAYYYVLRYGNTTPDQYEFKSDITIIRRQ